MGERKKKKSFANLFLSTFLSSRFFFFLCPKAIFLPIEPSLAGGQSGGGHPGRAGRRNPSPERMIFSVPRCRNLCSFPLSFLMLQSSSELHTKKPLPHVERRAMVTVRPLVYVYAGIYKGLFAASSPRAKGRERELINVSTTQDEEERGEMEEEEEGGGALGGKSAPPPPPHPVLLAVRQLLLLPWWWWLGPKLPLPLTKLHRSHRRQSHPSAFHLFRGGNQWDGLGKNGQRKKREAPIIFSEKSRHILKFLVPRRRDSPE